MYCVTGGDRMSEGVSESVGIALWLPRVTFVVVYHLFGVFFFLGVVPRVRVIIREF